MRKLLSTVVAVTVLVACGGTSGTADPDTAAPSSSSPEPTGRIVPDTATPTTTGRASTTPTTTAATGAAVTTPEPVASPAPAPAPTTRPNCSDGGSAAELQRSFDKGHQPWRADPLSVAGAGAGCYFGGAASSIEPAGPGRYLATDAVTGEQAVVELTQPLGSGTVWLIAAVVPT
jgi:hypothetical protein